ncbi:PucR family transcriptional regulator [Streptomyces sp. S1A]|uniref:PucR family transcriptional regulator n=1 Tax=Streptomyces chitinivorans TaxID=1257027 RepID=A0ABW7I0E0_9ACTN|nr:MULTISPECIES: PucR family transcriptional regulator [Streptomyces]MCG3042492.1 PucR family transcriptional regulator [Streptomyces sp. ICN903]MDH2408935.1 PucR family transcriptional regulator [Streptomyces chitinivorans]
MPITLASLVQNSSLKLAVLAGEGRLDAPVRWAHVSELADPVPYLDGGELLLVTAMKLDVEDAEAMRRYVARLDAAGVVGLGFAAGVAYDTVPPALLDAAREAGFPLLEVPRRTPFLAIVKAVSAAGAAEQYRAVKAGFEAQREMTRAVLSARGTSGLLAKLAAHVDGWAALYDVSGALVAAAPSWASRRAAELTDEVRRLRDRSATASAVVSGTGGRAGDRVELQSIGSGRRVRAVLAVGTGAPPGTAERYAVNSAVALLTLTTERSRALLEAEQRLGAAVLRMLLAGEADHARAVAGSLYGTLLDEPLRVVVAEGASARGRAADAREPAAGGAAGGASEEPGGPEGALPAGVEALAEKTESAAARAGESVLLVRHDRRLVGLVADGGAAAAACADFAGRTETAAGGGPVGAGTEHGVVVGVSAPAGLASVAAAFKQAGQALSVARRRGRALVEHEDVASGSVLPLLADEAVRAFADGMLRALYEHDAHGRGDLVASLHAWLSRHGQWDAAAADLGVHRHTLRYRMRRVEEILGRSLDDPDVRMELWLALKATATVPPVRKDQGRSRKG